MTGERHTRQGMARGQRHGLLDTDGPYDARRDPGSHEATNLRKDTRPYPDEISRRLGSTRFGGLGGCWCGEPMGHDWPGKVDGAPHPREARP